MRIVTSALVLGSVLLRSGAAAELPAGKWTLIDQKKFGNRLGARVVWDAATRRLLVLGGDLKKSKREDDPPAKDMAFDPATGNWEAWKGELPPPPPTLTIADPVQKLVVELPPELKEYAGEMKPKNSPLADLSPCFLRTRHPRLIGAAVIPDTLNKEILLVGGFAGGMEHGSVGVWTFSLQTDEWRRVDLAPDATDLRAMIQSVATGHRHGLGLTRNCFYSGATGKNVGKFVGAVHWPTTELTERLLDAMRTDGPKTGSDPRGFAIAQRLASQAQALVVAAKEGFDAGNLAAELIAKSEDAAWRLDEAAAALATEPTPRYAPTVGFDPERKLFVLFGGDRGDYMLADTWLYDPAKRSWRQFWSKSVPEARCGGQMVWLPKAKKLALLGGNTALRKLTYQNFLQPCSPDVWLFDPDNGWQLAVKAGDEVKVKTKDNFPLFMNLNPVV
ncbi:MAG: hypothetical protein FJ290_22635, partial [Planctomycetes bacterium]|nr:hypothetical protein [Planctomycetota bacterium]